MERVLLKIRYIQLSCWWLAVASIIEFVSCFPGPKYLSSFVFLSAVCIPWVELITVEKPFLSAALLNSVALEAAESDTEETVGLSTSSLLLDNFRKSVAFDCKENASVLPEPPASFLDSAGNSDLILVLGTITGMTSDLLKVGRLAVELILVELLFRVVALGTAAELAAIVFGLEFKLILWGVPGTFPVA